MNGSSPFTILALKITLFARGMFHAAAAPAQEVTPKDLEEGSLAPGIAGRYVPWRRLSPQRRFPPQLWIRVRRHDGDRQEQCQFRVRSLRHLRVVSETGCAVECQSQILQGQDADLERFRRASQLRRFLEEASVGIVFDTLPIPPSRCRIVRVPSRRRIPDRNGKCGWWRTSVSPSIAPMC
jgi:hypothetical protein